MLTWPLLARVLHAYPMHLIDWDEIEVNRNELT